jgi:hypothetical protein
MSYEARSRLYHALRGLRTRIRLAMSLKSAQGLACQISGHQHDGAQRRAGARVMEVSEKARLDLPDGNPGSVS